MVNVVVVDVDVDGVVVVVVVVAASCGFLWLPVTSGFLTLACCCRYCCR